MVSRRESQGETLGFVVVTIRFMRGRLKILALNGESDY